jgi:hypothetical protein
MAGLAVFRARVVPGVLPLPAGINLSVMGQHGRAARPVVTSRPARSAIGCAVCLARSSGLATTTEGIRGPQHRPKPPGLQTPGLIERRVEQAPQYAGFVERRLPVPDEVDQGAIGGLCRLARLFRWPLLLA